MRELDNRPANNLPDYKPHLLFSKKAESAGRGTDESFNYRQYLRVVESSASPQFYYLLIVRALDGRLIRRGDNKLLSGKTKSWPRPIDGGVVYYYGQLYLNIKSPLERMISIFQFTMIWPLNFFFQG